MAELDGMKEMEKAFGNATMPGERAEQTGSTAESEAKTSEQSRAEALTVAKTRYAHLKIDTGPITEEVAKSEMEDAVYLEVGGYSITPKTFQSRTFFSDEEPSGDEEKESLAGLSSSDVRSAEERTLESTEITGRLSIADRVESALNKLKIDIRGLINQMGADLVSEKSFHFFEMEHASFPKSIVELRDYATELESFLAFANRNRNLILTFKDMYKNDSDNEVVRFGINVSGMNDQQVAQLAEIYTPITAKGESLQSSKSGKSSKKSKQDDSISAKMLHPLEALVLQDAVDHLESSGRKTALVDIFARNDNNSIKQENSTPETHSVVLCKTAEGIMVIDPTDAKYSKHLEYGYSRLKFFRDSDEEFVFVTLPKGKIYIPDAKNTGPNPDQSRDCIDIAAKLALELNRSETYVTAANIMSSSAVKVVTNSVDIMTDYVFQPREAAVRVKQSSDDGIRQIVNKILLAFNSQIQLAHALASKSTSEVPAPEIIAPQHKEEFKRLLKSPVAPEKYKGILDELLSINAKISKELEEIIIGHVEEMEVNDVS